MTVRGKNENEMPDVGDPDFVVPQFEISVIAQDTSAIVVTEEKGTEVK